MLKRQTALAFVLTWFSGTALAQNLPEYYPQSFQFKGTIESVDEKGHSLIADDYVLSCEPNVMVHTLKRPGGHFDALRVGQRIGVRFLNPTAPKRIVSDIWILPAD